MFGAGNTGKYNGFTAKCANFCAADIKHIAEFGNILQGEICFAAHQSIAQPGSVQI